MRTTEHGILMRAEMILALLNSKVNSWPAEPIDPSEAFKWQTRRPAKKVQHRAIQSDNGKWYDANGIQPGRELVCPYGKKGDALYVKETFGVHRNLGPGWICYRADLAGCPETLIDEWKPSIFMPKKLCRIWLQLTEEPTIERVSAISEEDAKAEGIIYRPGRSGMRGFFIGDEEVGNSTARGRFSRLYDSIHGAGVFENGPWVWKLVFKRIL